MRKRGVQALEHIFKKALKSEKILFEEGMIHEDILWNPGRFGSRKSQRTKRWTTTKNGQSHTYDSNQGFGRQKHHGSGSRKKLNMTTTTLYVYLNGDGSVKEQGHNLLNKKG